MTVSRPYGSPADRSAAARNALVARYTIETLGGEQKQEIEQHMLDLLILSGISDARAAKYRSQLRETQYYGMAAIAMAFLGIRPALQGILARERWAHVRNPLVALTNADRDIQAVSDEIHDKHRVRISISDEDKQRFKWHTLLPEGREQKDTEMRP